MSLLNENARRWQVAKFKADKVSQARAVARNMLKPEKVARYKALADRIQASGKGYIPWWVIPLIHQRECIGGTDNWKCNIGQGSPFNVKSKIIPYNGPFNSWEDAAFDSLVNQAPRAAKNDSWGAGATLTMLEKYNGLGYANKGKPSPYIWSGSDQYVKGKYVRDGVYDANEVDKQLGVAIVISEMMKLDPSITFEDVPGEHKVGRKAEVGTTIVVATATTEAASQAVQAGSDPWIVAAIVIAGIVAAAVALWIIVKKKKGSVSG